MMTDPKIERLLERSELHAQQLREVREAIYSSPYLVEVMKTAIDQQRLRRIGLTENPHEGGHYDAATDAINLNPGVFNVTDKEKRQDYIVGVIGHETGHALMARSAEVEVNNYAYHVQEVVREAARAGDSSANISQLARAYVDSARKDEALAELVSMNSVASRVEAQNGHFDRADFLGRAGRGTSCIEGGALKAGIRLEPNGQQLTGGSIDSAAVEKVAVCHFDQSSRSLGHKGTSNYADYYAAGALGMAADVWRDYSHGTTRSMPTLAIDVDLMKTSRQRMEDAGVDLGQPGRSLDVVVISGGQGRIESISQPEGVPSRRHPDALQAPLLANDPAHPDFPTYERIHQWTRGIGHWNEEQSGNVAAALYKQQAADPLVRRVDKVSGALGGNGEENVFAIYAPYGDKGPFFHAQVDGRQAAQQPAQQNLEQAEQIRQQQLQGQQAPIHEPLQRSAQAEHARGL